MKFTEQIVTHLLEAPDQVTAYAGEVKKLTAEMREKCQLIVHRLDGIEHGATGGVHTLGNLKTAIFHLTAASDMVAKAR